MHADKISKQTIGSANWILLVAYDKIQEDKDNLKRELLGMQADFQSRLTRLKNKTISHFQDLQLAQASQNEKWPQGKQSIRDEAIRSFVKIPEIHQPGRFCQRGESTSENPKSVVSLQLCSWAKVERVHSRRIKGMAVGAWRKVHRFVESPQSFSTSLE